MPRDPSADVKVMMLVERLQYSHLWPTACRVDFEDIYTEGSQILLMLILNMQRP